MNLSQVLELLSQENVAANEMTGAFLEDAAAGFAGAPAAGATAIRSLRANDPTGFVLAAVQMLISTKDSSPGTQHIAGLLSDGQRLMDGKLSGKQAVAILARNLRAAEPLLDARLISKMLAKAGDIRAVQPETALRVLSLVHAISDCSHLSSYLVQLLRHPSSRVRSKAALELGRANLNLDRITEFMTSADVRLQANAVESLWEWVPDVRVLGILRETSQSTHRRVALNALFGLCRAGDKDAFDRLKHLAGSSDPLTRSGVAWVLTELGDPAGATILASLKDDPDKRVRTMAARAPNHRAPEASDGSTGIAPAPALPDAANSLAAEPAAPDDSNASSSSLDNQTSESPTLSQP